MEWGEKRQKKAEEKAEIRQMAAEPQISNISRLGGFPAIQPKPWNFAEPRYLSQDYDEDDVKMSDRDGDGDTYFY